MSASGNSDPGVKAIAADRVPMHIPDGSATPPVADTPIDDNLMTMAPDIAHRDGAHHSAPGAGGPPPVMCGECEKVPATFECLDCAGEWYCRPCAVIVHSKGRRKTHAQFKEHPLCDVCRSKRATLQCEKCDEYYCTTRCAYGAHDGSPRGGSKKRLHQWASLPKEGLAVVRPPHLEHAVDTRGGRNSFGIALADLTLTRFEGVEDGIDGGNQGADHDSAAGGNNGNNNLAGMAGDDLPLGRLSTTPEAPTLSPAVIAHYNSSNGAATGGALQERHASLVPVSPSAALAKSGSSAMGARQETVRTATGALVVMNPEEKVAAGRATEAHFFSDSPVSSAKHARDEITAAIIARNLPAPDLDEVVTLVTSARTANDESENIAASSNRQQQQQQGSGIGNQQGNLTSVHGSKPQQLIVESGFALKPFADPAPERLLLAGLTVKEELESKARNAALARKIADGTAKTKSLVEKIHGWRRWDAIRSEPAMFGQHPTPLIVNRPLAPLLPGIQDVNEQDEPDASGDVAGFASFVPFFEKSCHDESFLLAVAALLASNSYQHVKVVRFEDVDVENGVFTPRLKGGPVINVVAPGFDAPQQDNRQQKKKALERADAAAPSPIGNIFLTTFAGCERLQELGVATFRFYKPSTGDEVRLGRQRHLVAHRSSHKATNGVVPPVLDPVEHFVTVDTFLPVYADGRPAFGRTDVPDEFWLALLEKAYATQAGGNNNSPASGLAALVGGSPIAPLFALCGGEPTQLQWSLPSLDSSFFATGGSSSSGGGAGERNAAGDSNRPLSAPQQQHDVNDAAASPLALRSRTISIVWWMLQIATHYNLPICVTKRLCKSETETENAKTTWHRLESGLGEVEDFEWLNGDVVFFAVNHVVDKNLVDAQQYLEDDDELERSSSKSGMSGSFNQSKFSATLNQSAYAGNAVQSQKEEHRLVKLRQLYNTARENEIVEINAKGDKDFALPLWHDGSNKWSDIVSRVSGTSGVASFAQKRQAQQLANQMAASGRSFGLPAAGASMTNAAGGSTSSRPVGSSSIRGHAESAMSRRDAASNAGGAAGSSTMWNKSTRKALQHQVADERLTWMDVETFAQKYNTILVAHNLAQHKHHSFFGAIDMRIAESIIAKSLPHFLVVVEKRELENSDEADDRKWAEGIDPAFASIKSILKPPRGMAEDLRIGDKAETDDDAEDGKANDDTASVASSQVSISESLADMGTMASRRSLILRITVTQPATRVDPHLIASSVNAATAAASAAAASNRMTSSLNGTTTSSASAAAAAGADEHEEALERLAKFKAVLQPEDLTLYAFRVQTPTRQELTKTTGPKGDVVYSLPVHTKCLVNPVTDATAIGTVPQGLNQTVFEMEAPVGVYNFVVAPTRGMGRADLPTDCVSMAHFSMHVCAVRNGENFEVKAGKV